MPSQRELKMLNALIHCEVDSAAAYRHAIDHIRESDICAELIEFRADNLDQVEELTEWVQRLGGTPGSRRPDLRGRLVEAMTTVMGQTGTAGALQAMRLSERLTRHRYESALKRDLTGELRALLERHLAVEKRHLRYLEELLYGRET